MAGLSDRGLARRVEIRDLCTSSGLCPVPISTVSSPNRAESRSSRLLSHELRIHEAVLSSFFDPASAQIEQLMKLSATEWKRLIYWLDVSGLALYLADRFVQLGVLDALPEPVVDDLQRRMKDNTQRTRGMVVESVAIQLNFQEAGLSYAVMKGFSLSPSSVPRPELRHQFDLDFLMAEKSAPQARRILERRGYRLYAISGRTWEFKINETPHGSIKDLYKDVPYRAVELHLEAETTGQASRLDRVRNRELFGIMMPVLSPVDLFLGQAMHVFKDVSSAFFRTAHLLEFYRHVVSRRDDNAFWHELRLRVGNDRRTCLGLGVVTYLMTSIMGNFAPEALTAWTVQALPPAVRLWVELYGRRTTFGKHPGTKLYLLLQKELEKAGVAGKRRVSNSLLPFRLPPIVIRGSSDETLSNRIARYRVQGRFIASRLRFHIVEGLRYAVESYRWSHYRNRLSS
jgi:Uncharacterised nucleotidyltransferase